LGTKFDVNNTFRAARLGEKKVVLGSEEKTPTGKRNSLAVDDVVCGKVLHPICDISNYLELLCNRKRVFGMFQEAPEGPQ
jgi:hypothetical protein